MITVVNSEGEISINDEYAGGYVNTTAVAKKHLNVTEYEIWMEIDTEEAKAIDAYVQQCCYFEMVRDNFNNNPLPIASFVQRVWNLQTENDSRFRVYGTKNGSEFDSPEEIIVVTEVANFVDQTHFWDKLNQIATENGYEVRTLLESERFEKSHPVGKPELVTYGQNHGRMERQVEIVVNVTELSKDRWPKATLKEIIKKLEKDTDPIWETNGVGVC